MFNKNSYEYNLKLLRWAIQNYEKKNMPDAITYQLTEFLKSCSFPERDRDIKNKIFKLEKAIRQDFKKLLLVAEKLYEFSIKDDDEKVTEREEENEYAISNEDVDIAGMQMEYFITKCRVIYEYSTKILSELIDFDKEKYKINHRDRVNLQGKLLANKQKIEGIKREYVESFFAGEKFTLFVINGLRKVRNEVIHNGASCILFKDEKLRETSFQVYDLEVNEIANINYYMGEGATIYCNYFIAINIAYLCYYLDKIFSSLYRLNNNGEKNGYCSPKYIIDKIDQGKKFTEYITTYLGYDFKNVSRSQKCVMSIIKGYINLSGGSEMNKEKLVTVGIPVCNEGQYIRETLESVIANYDYIDQIIITDNASDDDTDKICQEYVNKYNKIKYIHLNERISMSDNWRLSLNEANTKYFMWLAGHDIISKNYFKILLFELQKNPDAVAGVPNVYHFEGDLMNRIIDMDMETTLLSSSDILKRVIAATEVQKNWYIANQIFDRKFLKKMMTGFENDYIHCDHIMPLQTVLEGPCAVSSEVGYYYRIVRKETQRERRMRYKENLGIVEPVQNPCYYVPMKYVELCREYIPEQYNQHIERRLLQSARLRLDADIKNEDWIIRHDSNKMLEYLENLNKDIVIFGTGDDAMQVIKNLGGRVSIRFFVDNNPRRQGKILQISTKENLGDWSIANTLAPAINGGTVGVIVEENNENSFPVVSANKLMNLKGQVFIIVATSKYYQETCNQLEDMGFVYWDDFICWQEVAAWKC